MKSARSMLLHDELTGRTGGGFSIRIGGTSEIALSGILGQRLPALFRFLDLRAWRHGGVRRPNLQVGFHSTSRIAWRGRPKGNCRRLRDIAATTPPHPRIAPIVGGTGPN